jgi:hypothetical protein
MLQPARADVRQHAACSRRGSAIRRT